MLTTVIRPGKRVQRSMMQQTNIDKKKRARRGGGEGNISLTKKVIAGHTNMYHNAWMGSTSVKRGWRIFYWGQLLLKCSKCDCLMNPMVHRFKPC